MARVGSWNRELIDEADRLEGTFDEVDPNEEGNRGIRNWLLETALGILTFLMIMMMVTAVVTVFLYIPLTIITTPKTELVEDYIEQEYPDNLAVYEDTVSGREGTYFVAKNAQETVYVEVEADSIDIEDFTHTEELVTEYTTTLKDMEYTSRNYDNNN